MIIKRFLADGRRARLLGLALSAGVAAALAGPASSMANHAPESCTSNAQNGKGCVTVSDTPDPARYGLPVSYTAVVTNRSKSSNLTHVALHEALPDGTTCVSATSTVGTASCSGETASAAIGTLKKGAKATVTVDVTAPPSPGSDAPDQAITNVATLTFAENNPNDPGKDVSATYAETTTVNNPQYCRPEEGDCTGQTSSADGLQDASAFIPTPTTDVLLTMDVLDPDEFRLLGQVTIQGMVYVCRDGGFFEIDVTDVATGLPYVSDPPMKFHLHWTGPKRISPLQTEDNFVVFRQLTPDGPIEVIGDTVDERCPAEGGTGTATTRICDITLERDASGGVDLSADLITDHNGRCR